MFSGLVTRRRFLHGYEKDSRRVLEVYGLGFTIRVLYGCLGLLGSMCRHLGPDGVPIEVLFGRSTVDGQNPALL